MRSSISIVVAASVVLSSCGNDSSKTKTIEKTDMTATAKTVSWAHVTNIYEVNLRQYSTEGTFNAFVKELPRLKDMGVETLWFMPVTPIAEKNKKGSMGSQYACSDYTAINPEFGTLNDFKSLVKEAHQQGFKVLIDWVANHTGWDHVWTKEHPEYYLKDSTTNDFLRASGMDDIIELDYTNPAMRKAMIDAMKYWVKEADIDGFRCDLAAWVEVDFWQEARPQVDSLKHLFWLGEFDELENPDYGKVFDASYCWKWMHTTRDFYQHRKPLTILTSLLQQYSQLGDESMRAWFTTNHDENSWNGTEYEKYGEMAKALAVFSATWNGIPLLYSGQELPNKKRLEFFEKDTIEWNGNYELHDFYKTLFKLRDSNPALRGGDKNVTTYMLQTSQPENILAYLRKSGDREVLVVLNFSPNNFEFSISDDNVSGEYKNALSGDGIKFSSGNKLSVKGWEYFVFER